MVESLVTLSLALTQKVENAPNELDDLAEDISSQSVKVPPGFFLLLIRDKAVI